MRDEAGESGTRPEGAREGRKARVLALRLLNPRSRALRWPLKLALLGLLVLGVMYPRPNLLLRNAQRWADLDALIEPTNPRLEPLARELERRLQGRPEPADALRQVESLVRQALPYEWDWVTWGVADYVPTVDEALDAGREDCDGRAVVAASLLRRLGYDARLVSDLSHVWVWTPQGQTMSPVPTASGRPVVGVRKQGSGLDTASLLRSATLFEDVPRALAFGVAVFPPAREIVLMLGVWVLLLGPRPRWRRALPGLAALGTGLTLLRSGGADALAPDLTQIWAGVAAVFVGLTLTVRAAPARSRPLPEAVPEVGGFRRSAPSETAAAA